MRSYCLSPRLLSFRRLRVVSIGIALAIVAFGLVPTAAHADYPSWNDVQKAKANEASAAAEASRLDGLLASLQRNVDAATVEAEEHGALLERAEAAFDGKNREAQSLTAQASASQQKADDAQARAGTIAAQLYRTRGRDATATLLLSGNSQDAAGTEKLLSQLGSMAKLTEQSKAAYESASVATRTAQSLAQRASAAASERDKKRNAAQEALSSATDAARAASRALSEQNERAETLAAQIAALRDTTTKTTAEYQAGVEARAAAQADGTTQPSTPPPSGGVSGQGWAVPARGPITDGFGPRVSPGGIGSTWHMGIDIGASCGSPIYAAHSGTVTYAGVLGTYGNFILLNHGGGIETGYAHITNGGIRVTIGQTVSAGQVIALVGQTGAATGCHLHYEVRINGEKIDGVPFMRQRGAALG